MCKNLIAALSEILYLKIIRNYGRMQKKGAIMIGTILSFIIAVFIYITHIGSEVSVNLPIIGIVLLAIATLFLFIPTLAYALAWGPLQRAEQDITPRILFLFRIDRPLRIVHGILLFFPLISYFIAIDVLFLHLFSLQVVLSIWIFLLGMTLDALHHSLTRVSKCLDPFEVVKMYVHEATICIQDEREQDLCDWIDALSEISLHSIERGSNVLCNESAHALQQVARLFLDSSKSISHVGQTDKQAQEMGITDKVSFTLFFLMQRLEMINDKAAEKRLEPICSNLVTEMGKIAITSAKYDISMPSYPLSYLGRISLVAQRHHLTEVGSKALCTLLEVAKSILTDIDITYLELQPPFFSLISQMEEITKEMFRQDKSISIKLLIQPFKDLRELFTTEKLAQHQDTPAIIADIDRVLGEYVALEEVLRSVPPISLPETSDFTAEMTEKEKK